MLPLLLPSWMNPEVLLHTFGQFALAGTSAVLFVECSIFPVLPGDSLLFTVGLFTANGVIGTPLWLNCIVLTVFAVLGNVAGYWIGHFFGPKLFKERSGLAGRIFKPEYIEKTHALLEKYGNRALVMARFVPFVRTFITWIAGAGRMRFRHFIAYTAIGGVLWATGITILGYYLGQVAIIRDNLEAALILIVLVSLVPMVVEVLLRRRQARTTSGTATR